MEIFDGKQLFIVDFDSHEAGLAKGYMFSAAFK
jgi:hypothetical protein